MAISTEEEAVWRECGASDDDIALIAAAGGMVAYAGDVNLAIDHQDMIDPLYHERLWYVRGQLRALGWQDNGSNFDLLRGASTIKHTVSSVGAGKNVVGATWRVKANATAESTDIFDTMSTSAHQMAAHLHLTASTSALHAAIPRADGPYGMGFRDAIESLRLALEVGGVAPQAITAAIETALDAYGNDNGPDGDDLMDLAIELVEAFPECETDEELNGGDCVDRVGELYPRIKVAVERYRPECFRGRDESLQESTPSRFTEPRP